MLDWLLKIDTELFLYLNHWRADWMDPVMIFLSAKKVWIPLYVIIFGAIIYSYKKWSFVYLLALILSVTAADQITSGFMKPYFKRYRPCHESNLTDQVLTPSKCGGKYGYASSHAANTFAVAFFIFFLFNREQKKWPQMLLIVWAALISYSRIYLGVHYPLDIITGALIGIVCAFLLKQISFRLFSKLTS